MATCTLETPVGPLVLTASDTGLTAIRFATETATAREAVRCEDAAAAAVLGEAAAQLRAYFAGRLRTFDLPLAPSGTAFQHEVWRALAQVPFGETIAYRELARRVARPGAARAVGAANGRNPLPIVVPCHRVIAADSSLGGYAAGAAIKRRLLALEGAAPS